MIDRNIMYKHVAKTYIHVITKSKIQNAVEGPQCELSAPITDCFKTGRYFCIFLYHSIDLARISI
jgi:hypothetical protein